MSNKLGDVIEAGVRASDFVLWGFEMVNQSKQQILRVYIDSDQGITIDDCALVSRQLSRELEVNPVINQAYQLEVSSPGVQRQLFYLSQWPSYCGRRISCTLHQVVDQHRKFIGILKSVEGEQLLFEIESKKLTVLYKNINKAHLVFEGDV